MVNLRRHATYASCCKAATPISFAIASRSFASAHHSDVTSDGSKRTSTPSDDATTASPKSKQHYLHIAPDGDWWTGDEIFAAKHLQPDYVRSVKIPSEFDVEEWLELTFGEDDEMQTKAMQRIYDKQKLPHGIDKI